MTHLDDLLYASEEDKAFFAKCIEGLPKAQTDGSVLDSYGAPLPYSCGAHSIKWFREIVGTINPKNILEIGTNICYSSALWLEMSDANIVTVDMSSKVETKAAVEFMNKKYGSERFFFILKDSAHLLDTWESYLRRQRFDTIFIDGGHLEEDVMYDIQIALNLGIKWLVFDDWLEQFGPGVQPAVNKHKELELIKVMGNIALVKNTSVA